MSTVWFSLKKSLHCRSDPSQVHDPKPKKHHLPTILARRRGKSGCSRSISNLRDVVVHGGAGSRGNPEPPADCSPRSIGSSEFVNPIAHEVILGDSRCELKITGFGGGGGTTAEPAFLDTLMPGMPVQENGGTRKRDLGQKIGDSGRVGKNLGLQKGRGSMEKEGEGDGVACHKCGKQFGNWENLEAHHLSKHAVTELTEGDSSRKVVEIICRSSGSKSENNYGRIDKILKIHNTPKTLARFEKYRETIKTRANKLPKKHPCCLADGNELLRFHGSTVACALGLDCVSDRCSVCRIIRDGFTMRQETKGAIGVFTASTSVRAFESIKAHDDGFDARKALVVCRVIAGRVHRPVENVREMAVQGFDSLAGKFGVYANIEELYLLSPIALLPCFVVICKP